MKPPGTCVFCFADSSRDGEVSDRYFSRYCYFLDFRWVSQSVGWPVRFRTPINAIAMIQRTLQSCHIQFHQWLGGSCFTNRRLRDLHELLVSSGLARIYGLAHRCQTVGTLGRICHTCTSWKSNREQRSGVRAAKCINDGARRPPRARIMSNPPDSTIS